MKQRLSYLLLIFALGLICLQRIPTAAIPTFNVDEAVSAVVAQEIAEGGLPYRDAIDHRGPLTYYFYALIFQLVGDWNMEAVHVAYALVLSLIALLLFWMDRETGLWGGATVCGFFLDASADGYVGLPYRVAIDPGNQFGDAVVGVGKGASHFDGVGRTLPGVGCFE